ncbi:MAG: EAL domain-containing protein [Planctomycetes bacterium]|nr:EAL domain-containing protein [Planctomycetota bacterium]
MTPDRPTPNSLPLILVVAADEAVRFDIGQGLTAAHYDVIECDTVTEASSFTLDTRPDLVLIDANLTGAFEWVRALTVACRTPVLVLTLPNGVDQALAAGASDCIVPPLHGALLRARVEFALRCSRAERAVERLTFDGAAQRDDANHHGLLAYDTFVARLEGKLGAARTGKGHVALMYLSVDHEFSAPATVAADARRRAVQITIQRLKDGLRSRDNVSQAEGEEQAAQAALISDHEIAVTFAGLERAQDAYKIARRLQHLLAQAIDIGEHRVRIPTSFGLAAHPEDGERAETLISSARSAMLAARAEGQGTIRFARPEMNQVIFERLSLEADLQHALDRGQLLIHYQPRIAIGTSRIVGVEALLRWKHPQLGLVSPAHFIPIAEESGLILPIGEWVLREACRQNARWRADGLEPISMAVNLSPAQFRETDLVGVVRRALDDAQLPASGLELELTESMLLHKGDSTVKLLENLKALGIGLAIDDFGTGYSSLNYIKRFPIDTLKIDQSFIRDMLTSEQDSTLTTSIVLMGKGLNLTVVAEGVETRSQLSLLRALGCDQAQGFLFSRAVPPEEIAPLVRAGFPDFLGAKPGSSSGLRGILNP